MGIFKKIKSFFFKDDLDECIEYLVITKSATGDFVAQFPFESMTYNINRGFYLFPGPVTICGSFIVKPCYLDRILTSVSFEELPLNAFMGFNFEFTSSSYLFKGCFVTDINEVHGRLYFSAMEVETLS